MRDLNLKREEIIDPPGKKYWPIYKGRDGCRGPMQWNGGKFAGFSEVKPWLPIHPDFPFRNVESQKNDPSSLFSITRKLIQIRKENNALTIGSYSPVDTGNTRVMAYHRKSTDQTILVILNFSSKKENIQIRLEMKDFHWISLIDSDHPVLFKNGTMELSPKEVILLSSKK